LPRWRVWRADEFAAGALVGVAVFSSRLGIANTLLAFFVFFSFVALRRGFFANRPQAHALWPSVVFFIAISLISTLASQKLLVSLDSFLRLGIFLFIPAAAALLDRRWWPRFLTALGVMTTVFAIWGIVQFMHGSDNLANRIRGPMSHYMIYGGWMLLGVLVTLSAALFGDRKRSWFLMAPAVLGAVVIFLSYTRNAQVGSLAGILLLAALWRRWLLLAYPLLALTLWLAFPRPVVDRVITTFDLRQPANYDRLCMAISGIQMVRDYPLTGVGPGMVPELYPLYRRDDAPRWRVPHLHNNPLQIAAERGLPGLAAYLWIVVAFCITSLRALPTLQGPLRARCAACLVAFVGITIAGLFESNFWSAPVQYLTFVIIGAGLGATEEKPE
jgi:O-antigen ligase